LQEQKKFAIINPNILKNGEADCLGSLNSFLQQLDWVGILMLLAGAAVSLVCITVHELSHGLAAYRLGDPTAKVNGRLTLNPLAHIDPVGLLMMLTVRVGWAKPVPVDMRNFRRPKRDMALTALAGPGSNLLLALAALGVGSLLYQFAPDGQPLAYALFFCCYTAVLSVGLGLFNLLPVPPLDGSKILFSLLPDPVYRKILRYERYFVLAVVLLAWTGVFSTPLSWCMEHVLRGMCRLTRFPFLIVQYYFF